MHPLTPRQTDIVALARAAGRVDVEPLAERFDVTPQTIRKDLNELCDRGVMQRYHGGAMLSSGAANLGHETRARLAADAKRRIGERAAAMIPDNASVLITIGTTTEQVAIALRHRVGLMVITNDINVAHILRGNTQLEVIVAGGALRHADGGIVGEAAVDFLRQFRVDYAIVGVSAIDADGSLLDFDYREVRVAKAIVESSRRTILVADSMKFARSAPVRVGHLTQVDHFVTDEPPPPALVALLREHGVGLDIVGGDTGAIEDTLAAEVATGDGR